MTYRIGTVALVLAACLGFLSRQADQPPTVAAQSQDYTIIKVPAEDIRGRVLDDLNRGLIASVDQRICAAIDLGGSSDTDSEGNKVLVVGREEQPAACRQKTGTIIFTRSDGSALFHRLPLRPGETEFLASLVPEAPIDPEPVPSQSRGFLTASVSIPGQGLVTGSGTLLLSPSGVGANLLIVPAYQVQPLLPADAIRYMYPLEANGEVNLVLPRGEYLVTYNNTLFRLLDAPESIEVKGGQLLSFPAVHVSLGRGAKVSLRLTAVGEPIAAPGPEITPPLAGNAGLR